MKLIRAIALEKGVVKWPWITIFNTVSLHGAQREQLVSQVTPHSGDLIMAAIFGIHSNYPHRSRDFTLGNTI